MSEELVEEGVPPEEPQAEAAELPARVESFHDLCTRLGIAGVEDKLATELQVTNEQQLMVLAELGLPETDCQVIGIDFTQRKAILEWATQQKRRIHAERLVSAATRGPIHTPEELAETEQIERKAREGRSLAASGFPWVDTHGEIQHKVTLWSYLYKAEAARIDPRKSAPEPEEQESASESEPEPEPEQEPALDGDSGSEPSGLRSWEAPNNAAMDEALAAAEAKKLADDLEPSALDQAAALMAARSGRPAPAPGEVTGPDGEAPAPQEPAAGKESGALDPAEAVVTETTGADSTSPETDGPNGGGGALQTAPPHVPSGRFGEGDWFCDARLRRCTSSKESWAEFRKLVPEKMKAVQPLIEAWLTRKAEAKQAAASESAPAVQSAQHTARRSTDQNNSSRHSHPAVYHLHQLNVYSAFSGTAEEAETKKEAVQAWLREAGINEKAEEMLREYIGEGGGLEDISALEAEDKLELGASYHVIPVPVAQDVTVITDQSALWCFVSQREICPHSTAQMTQQQWQRWVTVWKPMPERLYRLQSRCLRVPTNKGPGPSD
jgi:hypothetical protein